MSSRALLMSSSMLRYFARLPCRRGNEEARYLQQRWAVKAELASAVDWLTIDKVTPTAIVLTAKESKEKVKRSVKVNLTVGTVIKEIEVTQEGIMYYVLPYLKFPASLPEVIR